MKRPLVTHKAQKVRDHTLDRMRAIAIIGVIVTHILSKNLGGTAINRIWNYLHAVVPILVFCSGYLMYKKYRDVRWNGPVLAAWFSSRIRRLVVPYYIFVVIGTLLGMSPRTWESLTRSLVFVGVDYGWLPLLFLELMAVTPLYLTVWRKWGTLLMAASFLASLLPLAFPKLIPDYRLVMWIPWSLVYLSAFAAAEHGIPDRSRRSDLIFSAIATVSACVFVLVYWWAENHRVIVTLIAHKYPPDILYLSYGYAIGAFLLLTVRYVRLPASAETLIMRISKRSYELFFIHYPLIILLTPITRTLPITIQLIIGVSTSMLVTASYASVSRAAGGLRVPIRPARP